MIVKPINSKLISSEIFERGFVSQLLKIPLKTKAGVILKSSGMKWTFLGDFFEIVEHSF